MNLSKDHIDLQENQIITQYTMLNDKVIEIENGIKAKKAKIDQEINKIEAFNNIFLQNESDGFSTSMQTEKNSESIIRLAPILEPAFVDAFDQLPLSIQFQNTLIKQTNQFELRLLATQPMKKQISLLDIHTFPDSICIGSDGILRIYDITDGSVNFNWDVSVDSCQNNITCLANIPNPSYFAVGFEDGFARFFNTSGVVISEFLVSNDPILSLFFSSKQILFCYSKNKEISCWKGENNCLQTSIFDEAVLIFKEIGDDPTTNDIYIISESLNKYRWDIQNNDFILIEENADILESEQDDGKIFSISTEENQIKILPSQNCSDSTILSFDAPKYSLFDKNNSYFCISTGKRFSIYKVITKDQNEVNEDKRELNREKKRETDHSNFNIDEYLIGNVNKERIKNLPNSRKLSKK